MCATASVRLPPHSLVFLLGFAEQFQDVNGPWFCDTIGPPWLCPFW